jgi:hypothetical protein
MLPDGGGVDAMIIPGEVKLRIEELTKEQLVVEVLKLQRILDSRVVDRELRRRLVALEDECYEQKDILDRICEILHHFGYKTPDLPSIAIAIEKIFYVDWKPRRKADDVGQG